MLFEKTYGIDLGSSSVKVYSFFRNKSYMEKNMVASKGRRIIAMGNEAYEMFEKSPSDISVCSPMAFGMIANLELQEIVLYSMIRKIDHILGFRICYVFYSSPGYDSCRKKSLFSCGQWTLAQKKQGIYGRSSHCRCTGNGSGSGGIRLEI